MPSVRQILSLCFFPLQKAGEDHRHLRSGSTAQGAERRLAGTVDHTAADAPLHSAARPAVRLVRKVGKLPVQSHPGPGTVQIDRA